MKTNQSDFFPLPPSLFLPAPLSPSDDSDFFPHFPSSSSSSFSSFFVGIDGRTDQGTEGGSNLFSPFLSSFPWCCVPACFGGAPPPPRPVLPLPSPSLVSSLPPPFLDLSGLRTDSEDRREGLGGPTQEGRKEEDPDGLSLLLPRLSFGSHHPPEKGRRKKSGRASFSYGQLALLLLPKNECPRGMQLPNCCCCFCRCRFIPNTSDL